MTAKRYEVESLDQVVEVYDGPNRWVSVRITSGTEKVQLRMPEHVAADLLKRLQGINPRDAGPIAQL